MASAIERVRDRFWRSEWRSSDALIVFAVALAVRAANLALMPEQEAAFEFPDSAGYLNSTGLWLSKGSWRDWLAGGTLLPPVRDPGYVWFLSWLHMLGIKSHAGVAAVQGLLDAATCVFVGWLGRYLSAPIGRASGLLAAFSPTLVIHSTLVLQDTLMLFLFMGAIVALLRGVVRSSVGFCLLAGALLGLTLYVRSVVQFLVLFAFAAIPVLAVAAVLAQRWRSLAVLSLAFGLGLGLALAPQAQRSFAIGSLYPTTQSGHHALFWTITLIRTNQTGNTFDAQSLETRRLVQEEYARRGIDPTNLSHWELTAIHREIALRELLATPPLVIARVWLQGAIVSLFSPGALSDGRVRALERPSFFETPGRNLYEKAARYFFFDLKWFQVIVLAGLALSLLAGFFAIRGLFRLARARPAVAVGTALFIGYFLAISGPTAGPKYRMPYQPALLVLIAVGLVPPKRRESKGTE